MPRDERKREMNNGLVDEDSNLIPILTVLGIGFVVILLLAGLFMPSIEWSW
jgi:hypothetical protein